MFPKSCTAESICELYNQTKLSKTPRIVGIWLEITVGSGKCVFEYEDGKNKRNRWHIWNPHLQI